MRPDIVIRGGTVFDGSGAPPVAADVAITGDRIAEVGRIDSVGVEEIDAHGLHVAPGFIDIHSHSDFTLLVDPRALSAIHQGVTCEVLGNCGFGCFPIANTALAAGSIYGISDAVPLNWRTAAGYLERLEEARPAVNVLTLTPNAQLRLATVGLSAEQASPDDLARMTNLLEQSMEEGSWGFSTGLEYAAEAAATAEEISHLCRCVARRGGLYATHTRDRDGGSVLAVKEALITAENAQVQLQVSHLLPRNGRDAGLRCVELVDEAVARGQNVAFDMHTRLHGLTYLSAALPAWAREGSAEEVRGRLASPQARQRIREFRSILSGGGDWDRVILFENRHWPQYARSSISDIAALRSQEPFETVLDLLGEIAHDLNSVMVLIAAYTESQQDDIFSHRLCVPASDATTLCPDGPLAGSAFHGAYTWAAFFYRRMVRERRLLAPEAAIHKLTGQPAALLGLDRRGLLRRGAFADISVFDHNAFCDTGTLFDPSRPALGMIHVLVNGQPALRDGKSSARRFGRVLRFPGVR